MFWIIYWMGRKLRQIPNFFNIGLHWVEETGHRRHDLCVAEPFFFFCRRRERCHGWHGQDLP